MWRDRTDGNGRALAELRTPNPGTHLLVDVADYAAARVALADAYGLCAAAKPGVAQAL
jgi:hypothetical protein